MSLRNLCVYCGAATGTDPDYAADAERLGRMMAEAGIGLVYGGGSVGLMGVLARAVLENGGHVTGIIPQFLKDREIMLGEASELVITADMHERKRLMFDRSDAFLALPGGIGTLEETIEMMTWAQLGQHRKPIVLGNLKGFWAPLIALLEHMTVGGFVHSAPGGRLYAVVDRIDDVLPMLWSLTPKVGADDPGAAALM
jgi:uncharacterized protein (TIGR00730 family)